MPSLSARLLFIGLASILPFPSQAHATGAKRAFNRAVQRARAHPQQGTFYRGRWCKLTHLAPQPGSSPQTSHKPRLHGAAASTATRLHGLTGEAYQELLQWLQQLPPQNQPSIVHVQETHWTTSQEFTTPGWFMISSACPSPKAGGLLTMISTSLCDLDCISSSARVDGRLLHVRIDLGNSAIDAVNVYQKVYQTGGTRLEKGQSSTPVEQRTQVWNTLRALLNEFPTRHHLVLTGDFNTPAPLVRGLVGTKADMHRTPCCSGPKNARGTGHRLSAATSQQLGSRSRTHVYFATELLAN